MVRDLLHRAEAESESADASHPFPSPDRFCRPPPSHLRPDSDTIAMSERAKGPKSSLSPVSPFLPFGLFCSLNCLFQIPAVKTSSAACRALRACESSVCDCECDLRKLRDGLPSRFLSFSPLSLSCVFSSSASNRGEERRRRHFTLHYFST